MIDPLSVRARNGAAEVAQMERELLAARAVVEAARHVSEMECGHWTDMDRAIEHYDLIKAAAEGG